MSMLFSIAFSRALVEAERYHYTQRRKSTDIPYISHLLGVCGLVLEAGGNETEAIAALLHDAVEDAGGPPVQAAIERDFGRDVAAIVAHCSDAAPAAGKVKPPWLKRKKAYIKKLRVADKATLLVSAADKLHNLQAIQTDYKSGEPVFQRFSAPEPKRDNTLWYYSTLYEIYADQSIGPDPRRKRLSEPLGEILEWFTKNVR